MRKDKLESNPTIYNRTRRVEVLSCPHCKPNHGENAKRKGKHGKTKAKHKNKRR